MILCMNKLSGHKLPVTILESQHPTQHHTASHSPLPADPPTSPSSSYPKDNLNPACELVLAMISLQLPFAGQDTWPMLEVLHHARSAVLMLACLILATRRNLLILILLNSIPNPHINHHTPSCSPLPADHPSLQLSY